MPPKHEPELGASSAMITENLAQLALDYAKSRDASPASVRSSKGSLSHEEKRYFCGCIKLANGEHINKRPILVEEQAKPLKDAQTVGTDGLSVNSDSDVVSVGPTDVSQASYERTSQEYHNLYEAPCKDHQKSLIELGNKQGYQDFGYYLCGLTRLNLIPDDNGDTVSSVEGRYYQLRAELDKLVTDARQSEGNLEVAESHSVASMQANAGSVTGSASSQYAPMDLCEVWATIGNNWEVVTSCLHHNTLLINYRKEVKEYDPNNPLVKKVIVAEKNIWDPQDETCGEAQNKGWTKAKKDRVSNWATEDYGNMLMRQAKRQVAQIEAQTRERQLEEGSEAGPSEAGPSKKPRNA